MNTEKTLSETLADNLAYYVNDTTKRCVDKETNGCKYSGKTLGLDTEGCFIGRMLSEEDRLKADSMVSMGLFSLTKFADALQIIIPDIIKNNIDVLEDFQALHDIPSFWNTNSLSEEGKEFLQATIDRHKLDVEPFQKFL